jgi:hypothetical protein
LSVTEKNLKPAKLIGTYRLPPLAEYLIPSGRKNNRWTSSISLRRIFKPPALAIDLNRQRLRCNRGNAGRTRPAIEFGRASGKLSVKRRRDDNA